MRNPVVIFPDTTLAVDGAMRRAAPGATVVAKRPGSLDAGSTLVQYRNDSGPESGTLKTERWGVNIYAPKMQDALAIGRRIHAEVKKSLPGRPIVAASGGAGPYEVVDAGDAFDKHAHVYLTFELTVRGTDY